jgi:hypothetical protein
VSTSLWKLCKPFFSNKSGNSNERITLVEGGEIISDNCLLSCVFNKFFINVAASSKTDNFSCSSMVDTELLIAKFENHPSVKNIKDNYPWSGECFKFYPISTDDVSKIIGSMNSICHISCTLVVV